MPRFQQISKFKLLFQSIGLAAVILAMNYSDLLGGGGSIRMHAPFSLTSICLAEITGILLLGLAIFACLLAVKLTHYYPFVRMLLAIVIPPYLVDCLRSEIPFHFTDRGLFLGTILWGAFLLALQLKRNYLYQRIMRLGDDAGVVAAIFAVASIGQILFVMRWSPGPYQHTAAWATTPQPPRTHPKIVWIVFDELSYDQVFEHRAKDLPLPNFDAFRAQSTLFTDTQPVGVYTVKVLPGLLSGHVVDDYRFTFNNRLLTHNPGVHGFHLLDGSKTIFADAQHQGWRTSAVGWYNPYCSIYAGAIDDCYWMDFDSIDGNTIQRDAFWKNTFAPLKLSASQLISPATANRDTCNIAVRQRVKTFLDLQSHALDTLRDDQSDFVFLHLPVPHGPGIWSRITGAYAQSCDSSYIDNLALTDRTLGQIMQVLQASPRWKDTTVVVQGDHSWRTFLWKNDPSWTDEDDADSRRGFDPRPAMIIHQAGQTQPQTDPNPWSILKVHSVLEQVLRGQPVTF